MGEYSELVSNFKLQMKDLEPGTRVPGSYDIVEPKYDGWWVLLRSRNGEMSMITSGGDVKKVFRAPGVPDAMFVGEYVFGTNWAQKSDLLGKVVTHTILRLGSDDLTALPYSENRAAMDGFRREFLNPNLFSMMPSFSIVDFSDIWETWVERDGFEGLVMKNSVTSFSSKTWARMKRVCTQDYVVMGFQEGNGRLAGTLGAIYGGQYINGVLGHICTVGGGFSDELRREIWNNRVNYLYKVMECTGKALFDSGALRHPAFSRFRDDKTADQCVRSK